MTVIPPGPHDGRASGVTVDPEVLGEADAQAALEALLAQAVPELVLLFEQQTEGAHGGTFTSGAWRTRQLNTVVIDDTGTVALDAGTVSLAAGTYDVRAWAIAFGVGSHRLRLQDVSAAVTLGVGCSVASLTGIGGDTSVAHLEARFTLATPADVELQHIAASTKAGDGFGFGAAFASGVPERYAMLRLERRP